MDIIKLFDSLNECEKCDLIEVVNRYQNAHKFTDLMEWAEINREIITPRLYNSIYNHYTGGGKHYFSENITYREFMGFRNKGNKLWEEFIRLRGY